MSADDLSGQWSGEYAYPRDTGPVTPFLAIIEDHGGRLTGTIIEPNTVESGTLEADLVGLRHGTGVDFTKTYTPGASRHYSHPVDYVGSVSEDGQVIKGVWSLLDLDGTFVMRRELTREEMLEREAEVAEPVRD
ncbi:hypothetical protein OZN62_03370 [Aurantiacibacter sp. MUD11]|uniref:hypothetical protein n=1 Tax=Aurantiacibacter sp. MUD11 TaxID=3003265 RepID=UPI0022AA4901|nr:hypothetical protein [Aurantiacibacter sp. MUD11]WAT18634.1 hypothetical protein OZN62_03370 [Aurantiacibacter sp. MUD11]